MRLTSPDSSFYLTILGYQHPDAAGEPYDANWLSIHVEASGPRGAWTGTDPCLLTYECQRLADWLEGLGSGKAVDPAISFLEPVLLFRRVKTERGDALRVHFGNLINPSWRALENPRQAASQASASPDIWLDFPFADTDISAAGRDLRQEVRRYPSRAKD